MNREFTMQTTLGDLKVSDFGGSCEVAMKEDFGNTATLLLTRAQTYQLGQALLRISQPEFIDVEVVP